MSPHDKSSEDVDLERLIAGLLLKHDAVHPGAVVNIVRELGGVGILASSEQVDEVVRNLSVDHGLVSREVPDDLGYTVVEWQRRYRSVVGFGGVTMERDPESGRYLGPFPTSTQPDPSTVSPNPKELT